MTRIRSISRVSLQIFCLCSLPLQAEYRDALLIDNHPQKSLEALVPALEKHGFRCRLERELSDKDIKRTAESFASQTVTRGTALVVFCGKVAPRNTKDGADLSLVSFSSFEKGDRGASLAEFVNILHGRGGSQHQVLLLDAESIPKTISKMKGPENVLIQQAQSEKLVTQITGRGDLLSVLTAGGPALHRSLPDAFRIEGLGSQAISPRNKFVLGKEAGDEWVNQRGMVFVWCPPGRYTKGSPASEPGRFPDEVQTEVIIKDGFWIGKYELTVAKNFRNRSHKTFTTEKNAPITGINHDDGKRMFSHTLTQEERKAGRLANDWQYSLPTELQWEYAARAGTRTRYCFGDNPVQLPQYGNFSDKSHFDSGDVFACSASRVLDDGVVHLTSVGRYAPNAWGLHDVHGNIAEWCLNGAIRGGSFISPPENCRIAYRKIYSSRQDQIYMGYRAVIQKEPPTPPNPPAKKKK